MSAPHSSMPAGPQEAANPLPEVLSPYFRGGVLDGSPTLLEESYVLRYQVYCHERNFLSAEKYPDHLEVDAFDSHSVHLGVVNTDGQVVATTRLVQMNPLGLPMFAHCTINPEAFALHHPSRRVVEISRLSVSRHYNRRAGDNFFSLQGPTPRRGEAERRGGGEIVMTLYKAVYQASKRRGFTHWLAATERSLQRLLARYKFPFRQIGPETDYYGPVAPYVLDLAELDHIILSGQSPVLRAFVDGLEPQFMPVDEGDHDDDARPDTSHAGDRAPH